MIGRNNPMAQHAAPSRLAQLKTAAKAQFGGSISGMSSRVEAESGKIAGAIDWHKNNTPGARLPHFQDGANEHHETSGGTGKHQGSYQGGRDIRGAGEESTGRHAAGVYVGKHRKPGSPDKV